MWQEQQKRKKTFFLHLWFHLSFGTKTEPVQLLFSISRFFRHKGKIKINIKNAIFLFSALHALCQFSTKRNNKIKLNHQNFVKSNSIKCCNFPTDKCHFPTEEIMRAQNFYFTFNLCKNQNFKPLILHFEKKFRQEEQPQ